MMKNETFKAKLSAATPDNPVVVGVLAQDATSTSQIDRAAGFIAKMKALAEQTFPGAVAVTGHSIHEIASEKKPAVIIRVAVPPTTDSTDLKNAAQSLLNEKNLIGEFNTNEGGVVGFLAATNDATDLAKGGRYEGLVVAGFDAGATQKNAVRQGWFLGSVTQDPFQIGYKAVDLAVKAAKGETVADVDTGAKWYTSENMDQPDIAQLLYD
jgi:ribose transport system substrate-binding protein